MKFRFKNLGPIKEADLELGDLTIIAGRNNTGKTYLAYALYGFLKRWNWSSGSVYVLRDQGIRRVSAHWHPKLPTRAMRGASVDRHTFDRQRSALAETVTPPLPGPGWPMYLVPVPMNSIVLRSN